MSAADRLYILDDAGQVTEIRRPEYARRVSSQAGLASLAMIGPGAAAQAEAEILAHAAPSLVRMDAMEAVVEAALAVVAPMARWQDQQLTTEEIALRDAVRTYQEVAS